MQNHSCGVCAIISVTSDATNFLCACGQNCLKRERRCETTVLYGMLTVVLSSDSLNGRFHCERCEVERFYYKQMVELSL